MSETATAELNETAAPDAPADAVDPAEAAALKPAQPPVRERGWRDLWQIPTFAAAALMLTLGVLTAKVSSPGPDFDGALDDAAAMISAGEIDRALSLLNGPILRNLEHQDATTAHRRRFHLLRGDAIYAGQSKESVDIPENHRSVIAEYSEAESFLAKLGPVRIENMVHSMLALDRIDDAIERIRSLPPEESARKNALRRRVVERNLASEDIRYDETLDLLGRLAAEPSLTWDERLWISAREAELRLEAGYVEEALTHLLRSIQRAGALEGEAGGELLVLLAKIYFELGRYDDSLRQLERAFAILPEADARTGQAHVLAGRIAQMRGELQDARDHFTIVATQFGSTSSALPGEVGLAEINAAMGNVKPSIDAYMDAVSRIQRGRNESGMTREDVIESLLRQHSENFVREDFAHALRYASLAESLARPGEEPPPEVLFAIAQTHRAQGDALIDPVRIEDGRPPALERLDPVTRSQARAHYSAAGDYFLRHARSMILDDDSAFADSLWQAADSFDLAREPDKAIAAFSEYADGRPDDPRRPRAIFRLAKVHMLRGDFGVAAKFFESLIEESPSSGEGTRSYLPLARCRLLMDGEGGGRAEARRLLETLLSGQLLSPEAIEFRDALFELGRLHLEEGNLTEAIRRLTEAVERYPDDPRIERVQFHLAEAHRRDAESIGRQLQDALPETTRRSLTTLRQRRLEGAMALYQTVLEGLRVRPRDRLSELEKMHLRNAMFYRADCAFDLGRYDEAIAWYDEAAQRFAEEPASLVAMIQIVNAYVAQGRWRQAETANERARQRLEELPDEALERADLPLDARYWERWFESSAKLVAQSEGENPGGM